ncbi:MAG: Maf family protein [Proteobacteria bacterium]|nr:Maf family protein [Pseudomonadota bacterium]
MIKQHIPLILASNSPIRKKILADLGLQFEVIKPDFDEEAAKLDIKDLSISQQALSLTRGKALSISKKYPNHLVIASDQMCQLGEEIISKSNNADQAIAQLSKLNGKTHYQNNAVCLYHGDQELIAHCERAELKMRDLSIDEIKAYVQVDQAWGCAGSYKFESLGKHLFDHINGNQDCILGMAILPIISFMHHHQLIAITNK